MTVINGTKSASNVETWFFNHLSDRHSTTKITRWTTQLDRMNDTTILELYNQLEDNNIMPKDIRPIFLARLIK